MAPAPLWRLTALLVERFPRETLTSRMLDQQGIIHMVSNGTLDLGIIEANIPSAKPKALRNAGLRSCPLMVEELSIILPPSHPLAAYKSLTAAQLDRETFLIMTDIGFWRQRVDHAPPPPTPHSSSRTIQWCSVSSRIPPPTACSSRTLHSAVILRRAASLCRLTIRQRMPISCLSHAIAQGRRRWNYSIG